MHAAIGLVKSNPALTTFQVLSRVIVVTGVLLATPDNYAASSLGLPLALAAWSITEIIRYSYYFMNLIDYTPYLLTWLRYVLYGVALESGFVTLEFLQIYIIYWTVSDWSNWRANVYIRCCELCEVSSRSLELFTPQCMEFHI